MERKHMQRRRTSLTVRTRFSWAAIAALMAVSGLSVSSAAQPRTTAKGSATTNAVIEWNSIASTALMTTAAQPPHVAVLTVAMVQGAVYDAVNAIDGGHEPYLGAPDADPTDSMEAAAATAAFRVLVGFPERTTPLVGLVPTQLDALQPIYDAYLENVPGGASKTGGIEVGEAAADAMLTARLDDGRGAPFAYVQGTEPGEWRSGPPQGPASTVGVDPAPWVGVVRPFLVPNVEKLRTRGPNPLRSEAYAKDFKEVKTLGSLSSTKRTADQTAASIFWQDNGAAIWNRVHRSLAMGHGLDIVDSARLFAMTDLAAADGAIGCWNDKAYWSFWRPITAIRHAAGDGNPATKVNRTWVPLFDPTVVVSGSPLVTPGFPDHPAGHGCVSGATVHALQAFFGTDEVPFTAVSNKCSPAPCADRSFDRLSDALQEIIDVRVWSGIHFRTADEQGATLGKRVARYMSRHYFEPTS